METCLCVCALVFGLFSNRMEFMEMVQGAGFKEY